MRRLELVAKALEVAGDRPKHSKEQPICYFLTCVLRLRCAPGPIISITIVLRQNPIKKRVEVELDFFPQLDHGVGIVVFFVRRAAQFRERSDQEHDVEILAQIGAP